VKSEAILNFRFTPQNSLSLWERARVRAGVTTTSVCATLTCILSLQGRARKLFFGPKVNVSEWSEP